MAEQQDQRPVPPEGRSRGPIIHSGGEQDIREPVPPYEGRQQTGKSPDELVEERGRTGHEAGPTPTSQEEREGVTAADPTPAGPHGVGISTSDQGNVEALGEPKEAQAGRHETKQTGVGRSGPIDPESPDLQPGDQGG